LAIISAACASPPMRLSGDVLAVLGGVVLDLAGVPIMTAAPITSAGAFRLYDLGANCASTFSEWMDLPSNKTRSHVSSVNTRPDVVTQTRALPIACLSSAASMSSVS